MKKIGVLLSGCGHRDGSEVHEATLALLAIDEAGSRECDARSVARAEPEFLDATRLARFRSRGGRCHGASESDDHTQPNDPGPPNGRADRSRYFFPRSGR